MDSVDVIRCPKCQSDAEPAPGMAVITRLIGDKLFSSEEAVPAFVCPECGAARSFASDVIHRFELEIAEWMAKNGDGTPLALKFMRRMAKMTAAELAELLGTNP